MELGRFAGPRTIVIAAVVALAACGGGGAPDDAGADAGEPDAGAAELDAGPACGPPPPPYGRSLGSTFSPLELSDCGGEPYAFYGLDFCEASFTVLEQQAAWCAPSGTAAADLESEIVGPYGSRGVRVLEVLIQDYDHGEPDAELCHRWTERYGLSSPVLIDPSVLTQVYFPEGSLPALIIVDASGRIRYRQYGHDLAALKHALDGLLAGRDP